MSRRPSVQASADTAGGPAAPKVADEGLDAAFQALGAPAWRDRKQAVNVVHSALAGLTGTALERGIDRLLDTVLGPDVEARAGAREVLVRLGPATQGILFSRFSAGSPPRALIELIGEVADRHHVPLLVQLVELAGDDVNLIGAAAQALGQLGGPEAEQALLRLLATPAQMLRLHALDALRVCDAAVAVDLLLPLLDSPHARRATAALLGHSRDPRAAGPLVALLDDKLAGVRTAAAVALARLDQDLNDLGEPGQVQAALGALTQSARVRLRALLEHRDPESRAAAMRLCALAGDIESIAPALEVMDDPVAQERALAMVASFGASANPMLLALARTVGHGQAEHFFRMVGALPPGRVDPELLARLVDGLATDRPDEALAAAQALGRVGGLGQCNALIGALDRPGAVGQGAAEALAAVLRRIDVARGDVLQELVGPAWPDDGPAARNLCTVVGLLGWAQHLDRVLGWLGNKDPGVRAAAARALAAFPGARAGEALRFGLADEEPVVRVAACRSLGKMSEQFGAEALLAASHDPLPQVRAAAVQGLVELQCPQGLPRFRELLAQEASAAVVVHALAGLGRYGLDEDLPTILTLATSSDHEIVKAVARGLVGFRARRASALLVDLCDHPRWDVRAAAVQALANRGDPTVVEALRRVLVGERDPLVRQILGDAITTLAPTRAVERPL